MPKHSDNLSASRPALRIDFAWPAGRARQGLTIRTGRYHRDMARITTVQLIDDLDGSVLEDGSTVRWGLDGREYELDTSPANKAKLRKQLDKYLKASSAPKQRRSYRSSRSARNGSSRSSTAASTSSGMPTSTTAHPARRVAVS